MEYIEELNATIETWLNGENDNEWLLAEFRERLVDRCSPSEAFALIDEVVGVLLSEMASPILSEILEIILSLARKSNTTELPRLLNKRWADIDNRVAQADGYTQNKWAEIAGFYRRQ